MVINTCREALEWCHATVGFGHIVESKATRKNPRRLRCYRYVLNKQHVLQRLLPAIRPYLKIKHRQVDAALLFIESRATRPARSAFNTDEVDLVFDIRLANRRSYEPGGVVVYKKTAYDRAAFHRLLLEGRDGSIYHVVEWTPKMDALVGTDIDRKVGDQLGLKIAQVQRRRIELGRRPFGRS